MPAHLKIMCPLIKELYDARPDLPTLKWQQEAILTSVLISDGNDLKQCLNGKEFFERFLAIIDECRVAWSNADVAGSHEEDTGDSPDVDSNIWRHVDISSWPVSAIDSLLAFVEAAASELLQRIQSVAFNGDLDPALILRVQNELWPNNTVE